MDSISQSLNQSLNASQLTSGIGIRKPGASSPDASPDTGNVGNILQSFGGMLKEQMSSINQLQQDANQAQQTYAVGGDIELHNVMIASEKADLALQLAMQVRNKVVSAYQEITRMTV